MYSALRVRISEQTTYIILLKQRNNNVRRVCFTCFIATVLKLCGGCYPSDNFRGVSLTPAARNFSYPWPHFQQIFLGQPTQLQQNRQSRFSPSNNYGRISYVGHSVTNSRIRKARKSSGINFTLFFGAFAKLIKSDYCLRRICLFVRPHAKTRPQLDGFSQNLISEYISKIRRDNSNLIFKISQ
jgi:hypothetical protein